MDGLPALRVSAPQCAVAQNAIRRIFHRALEGNLDPRARTALGPLKRFLFPKPPCRRMCFRVESSANLSPAPLLSCVLFCREKQSSKPGGEKGLKGLIEMSLAQLESDRFERHIFDLATIRLRPSWCRAHSSFCKPPFAPWARAMLYSYDHADWGISCQGKIRKIWKQFTTHGLHLVCF